MALAELLARESGSPTWLVDIDIVTPYFRPRDHAAALADVGVRVLAPRGDAAHLDIPAIGGDVGPTIESACRGEITVVVDPGGEESGVRALASLIPPAPEARLRIVHLLNPRRTLYAEGELDTALRSIEASSRLRTTHLAVNSHLGAETTADIVVEGLEWARRTAGRLGLPLLFAAVPAWVAGEVEPLADPLPLLPIHPRLLRPWEVRDRSPVLCGGKDSP